MSEDRPAALLAYLRRAGAPVPAAEVADALGVTPRSVRGYVSRINATASPRRPVLSTPAGYLLDSDALGALPARRPAPGAADTPKARADRLIRLLNEAPVGCDVHDLAERFSVSDATMEADLGKVRHRMPPFGLKLLREGDSVRLEGAESARRRLVRALLREEAAGPFLPVEAMQRDFPHFDLAAFKKELAAGLGEAGYVVNEFALGDVLLHIATAVDRLANAHGLPAAGVPGQPGTPDREPVGRLLRALVEKYAGISFTGSELEPLVAQLTTRALAPDAVLAGRLTEDRVPAEDLAAVREIVGRLDREYQVDFSDPAFLLRLTVHVHNLRERAGGRSFNRNPLAASIKTSYPLIYDLAVFVSRGIQRHWALPINEDEIAFIAMHVGAHVEAQADRSGRVSAALVCPEYYELAHTLRERLVAECGPHLEITRVVTRLEDVPGLTADLVISTLPLEGVADTVVVRPFPGRRDFEAVRAAAGRVSRQRLRTARGRALLGHLEPDLFFRDLYARDETAMIRLLGERLVARGVMDEAQTESVLERERLSSTAFTDGFAVPHAMTMGARRSAIALVVNGRPMDWGDKRVSIVALIAFSPADRHTFRPAFEEFTELLGERSTVQRLVRNATDYETLLYEIRSLTA